MPPTLQDSALGTSLGRFVRRGEKGIFILAPMVGKRSTNDAATDVPSDKTQLRGRRLCTDSGAFTSSTDYLVICG